MVKQRIIEEASAWFGQTGIKSTTMDDIAQHTGMSKRTIYENFKDKETLLTACIEAFHAGNKAFSEKVFREADNVAEALLTLLQKSAEQASKWRYDMLYDIRKYYPQVYKNHLLCSHADQYREVERLVQRGMDEGVFRNDLNPRIIAYFFCRQDNVETLTDNEMERFSFTEIFENMVITFLRGVCTSKGLEIIDRYKEKAKKM
ncbi:MAG: TetR/AcrR family transcriptional regulator [Tannerella sp.]|jgi:AcrR family transcriptional regulator|nr:TetR/AcrR family transcriptional regulator [Tannerella sp.]